MTRLARCLLALIVLGGVACSSARATSPTATSASVTTQVGAGNPIAYALDGFAIYGSTEPDGTPLAALDEYNGHVGTDGVYHYHGTTTYPYVNGGLRGVVTAGAQVEPQPTTRPFRPAGEPLHGATITAFESPAPDTYLLQYSLPAGSGSVRYTVSDTTIDFTFTDPSGVVTKETYTR